MLLRCVDGRPVSAVTTQFLAWRKAHKRRVKRDGGCRLVVCPVPSKRPWLHRLEPKWVHGKRAIAEPDRKVQVDELQHRICAYDDCELLESIAQ